MFEFLKKVVEPPEQGGVERSYNENKLQIATCALFIEMAKSDDNFMDEEKEKIISIMKNTFNLDEKYVNELFELSEQEVKESISIYHFSVVINQYFSREEKYELLKNLWRLIFVDEVLDKYEEGLLKKIAGTLNMEHRDIIASKMEVKEELNKG